MSPSGVSISSVVLLIRGLRKSSPPRGCWRSELETAEMLERFRRRCRLGEKRLRPLEDGVGHRLGEPAGEGVLLARVVAAEQSPASELDLGSMAELRPRPRHLDAQ